MIHVRSVVPGEVEQAAIEHLEHHPAVCNIAVLRDVVRQPRGHLVLFDVAPEAADELIEHLVSLGLVESGSIAIEHTELSLSRGVTAARAAAPGDHDDAIVWAEVERTVASEAGLSTSYLVYFVISAIIAAAGVLTDSPILIIGAMVVGPDYGPIASLAYGLERRRPALAWRGLRTFLTGSVAGVIAAALVAALARVTDQVPDAYASGLRPLTGFISSPDLYAVIVAVAAAIAGVFALTHSKSGTLVGVLISVTTVPAIADIGVAAAFGRGDELLGALGQLAANIACLVLVGALTIQVLRRTSGQSAP